MTTHGASGASCPACGAPVTVSSARACATCGHDLTSGVSPAPRRAGVNGWRMAGVAIGFAVITGLIAYLNQFPQAVGALPGLGYFHEVCFYAPEAYVYALLRLPRARWRRVVGEAGVILLVTALLNLLAFGLPAAAWSDLTSIFISSFMVYALVSVIVGALLGTVVALWSASWRVVQARTSPGGAWLPIVQAACVIVGFFVIWQAALNSVIIGPAIFHSDIETAMSLIVIGQYIFVLGPAVAILAVAIVQALRLRSLHAPAA